MNNNQEQLKKLFNILGELRQEFNQLDKEAENLNEIAMNAAVTAAQTGKSIRIYTEISNQIAYSSKKMKNFIEKSRFEINSIFNFTLKVLSSNSLDCKLSGAISIIKNKSNLNYLQKKSKAIELNWKSDIKKISNHIYPAKAILKCILQIQYKLFGAYNSLIIESINLDGNQKTAISALSDNLNNSFESSIYCIEKLFLILKKICRLIKSL
ncbi:hypothetical protein [Fluviispira vulneris]|uniref:hypothetical protein n=1 Tax=Fluviispira vulneris TaxID=2763012 RepID=UPI001648D2DB|nr:hypothetical protein [Fluviispira vulneris]